MTEKKFSSELKRGDIVLVPFPFTDLTSLKVRPAVILSSKPVHDDIVIGFISSVMPQSIGEMEFSLRISHPDFSATGLKRDSVFKMNKLLTIHRALVLRRLGQVPLDIQGQLDNILRKALGL